MIQRLRTWRQASPALVNFEPGYCVNGWISGSPALPGTLLVAPLESRTERQNGALLPGCVLPRWAFDSSGLGSAGATKPAGGPALLAAASCAVAAFSAKPLSNAAAASVARLLRIKLRMPAPWGYFARA